MAHYVFYHIFVRAKQLFLCNNNKSQYIEIKYTLNIYLTSLTEKYNGISFISPTDEFFAQLLMMLSL